MSPSRVVIIGGGVFGLCSGYYLARQGYSVTILDARAEGEEGTSHGNAGMVVPSHFAPMASPSMISLGLRMMLNPKSPFGFRLAPDLSVAKWVFRFLGSANKAHVATCSPFIKQLNLASRAEYEWLASELGAEFGFEKRGLLMLCKTEKALHHEAEVIPEAERLGLRAKLYEAHSLGRLETAIETDVVGAVHFEDDAQLSTRAFLAAMTEKFLAMGGVLQFGRTVTGVRREGNRIAAVRCGAEEFLADEVVMASGAWAGCLSAQLGLELPVIAGKGYGYTLSGLTKMPSICAILTEARVAVTPMMDGLRVTGTMEMGSPSTHVNPLRLDGIRRALPSYYPSIPKSAFDNQPVWMGLRPCSPDGLPFIGRTNKFDNLTIATGGGMMGMSLGPIAGKLVSQMVSGQDTSLATQMMDPDRYAK